MMVFVVFFFASLALGGGPRAEGELVRQLERGEERYLYHCSACHGPRGGGFEEARMAFPEDHRRCERCHKPNNPRQMHPEAMTPHDAFSLGQPPPLKGALQGFPNAEALYHYVRAAMPGHDPGSLEDEIYRDIVAFIVALNEELDEGNAVGP